MVAHNLYKKIFLLLVVIGVLYVLEIKLYLTWLLWWYDMVLHFLSGIAVAMLIVSALAKLNKTNIQAGRAVLWVSVVGVFLVGLVWEFYELYFGMTSLSHGLEYVTDTTSDLTLDVLGGLVGVFYIRNILKEK